MKVKVLENFNKNKYLIERYYRELKLSEFVVCENYNFKANVFERGIIVFSLPDAYRIFNNFCIHDELPDVDERDDEDGDLEGSN